MACCELSATKQPLIILAFVILMTARIFICIPFPLGVSFSVRLCPADPLGMGSRRLLLSVLSPRHCGHACLGRRDIKQCFSLARRYYVLKCMELHLLTISDSLAESHRSRIPSQVQLLTYIIFLIDLFHLFLCCSKEVIKAEVNL
jgi:hypothetical protein